MDAFFGLVGVLAIAVALISLIVNKVRKRPLKRWSIVLGAGFVSLILGLSLPSSSTPTTGNTQADAAAKQEAKDKEKADADAKAKADAEAKVKAAADKAKNPTWNVKEMLVEKNGNIPLAVQMLKAIGEVPAGQDTAAGDVLKTPWNYYGKPIKFSGTVGIVQDYPPDSSFAKGGIQSQVVFSTGDGTIVDLFAMVPSGKLKVGDTISVVGYPVGHAEVQNKMGGNTTQLAIVTNKL